MANTIDELDLRIIRQLQIDGRISITDLTKNVKSTRPTVTKRLKRMMDEKLISFKGGISLNQFGFKIASVGLEAKKEAARKEVEDHLTSCPRVLYLFRVPGKANFHAIVWGENEYTINSTIESFRDLSDVDIIYTHYLGTPIHGDMIINVEQSDSEGSTPCGMQCSECYRFINSWCVGCPASQDYKSPY